MGIKEKGAGWKLAGERFATVKAYSDKFQGKPESVDAPKAWAKHTKAAHGEAEEASALAWRDARKAGCTYQTLLEGITIEIEATRIGWDNYFRGTPEMRIPLELDGTKIKRDAVHMATKNEIEFLLWLNKPAGVAWFAKPENKNREKGFLEAFLKG